MQYKLLILIIHENGNIIIYIEEHTFRIYILKYYDTDKVQLPETVVTAYYSYRAYLYTGLKFFFKQTLRHFY